MLQKIAYREFINQFLQLTHTSSVQSGQDPYDRICHMRLLQNQMLANIMDGNWQTPGGLLEATYLNIAAHPLEFKQIHTTACKTYNYIDTTKLADNITTANTISEKFRQTPKEIIVAPPTILERTKLLSQSMWCETAETKTHQLAQKMLLYKNPVTTTQAAKILGELTSTSAPYYAGGQGRKTTCPHQLLSLTELSATLPRTKDAPLHAWFQESIQTMCAKIITTPYDSKIISERLELEHADGPIDKTQLDSDIRQANNLAFLAQHIRVLPQEFGDWLHAGIATDQTKNGLGTYKYLQKFCA